MQRSLGIFLCGLVLGGLAGYALRRPHGPSPAGPTAGVAQSDSSAGATERSGAGRKAEDEKILLGDIATVPFQELYETLARQRPEDIAKIAQQLDGLSQGREGHARIKAFFAAWAHLDPNAAFAAAVVFQSKEARRSAISATDPAAAAQALISSSVPGSRFTPAAYNVGANWGASDPAAALAWAEQQIRSAGSGMTRVLAAN